MRPPKDRIAFGIMSNEDILSVSSATLERAACGLFYSAYGLIDSLPAGIR
jgi:hypothetical protein